MQGIGSKDLSGVLALVGAPALAAGLRKTLAGTGVSVAVEPELRALEVVLTVMAEAFAEGRALPGILSGEGVTVEGRRGLCPRGPALSGGGAEAFPEQ